MTDSPKPVRRRWRLAALVAMLCVLVLASAVGWVWHSDRAFHRDFLEFKQAHGITAVEGMTRDEVQALWGEPFYEIRNKEGRITAITYKKVRFGLYYTVSFRDERAVSVEFHGQ